MNRRACQLQKIDWLCAAATVQDLEAAGFVQNERKNDLLPERATNSMPSRALTGPAAVAHHGVQGQRLEGSLSFKGCKVSLQGGLLTAPALGISTVLLLHEYTDNHCTADDPLNCVWQDRIEAAPDVLKTRAIPQHLIMHAH